MGTYIGCDGAGNRYYENLVDYPFGQHRWVEPGDIHNFDSTSIPPGNVLVLYRTNEAGKRMLTYLIDVLSWLFVIFTISLRE